MSVPDINLTFAWMGIAAGFLSGMVLGLGFHQEHWLDGYASHRRRLYRLAHISFFGLGIVNLAFFATVRLADLSGRTIPWAAFAFCVGAVLMPLCCVIMAHCPRSRMIFAAPVISLIAGAVLTILEVL